MGKRKTSKIGREKGGRKGLRGKGEGKIRRKKKRRTREWNEGTVRKTGGD